MLSFSSLTLHAVKFIALKENTLTHSFQNHYSSRPNTLQNFPYGEIKMSHLREGIGGRGTPTRLKV